MELNVIAWDGLNKQLEWKTIDDKRKQIKGERWMKGRAVEEKEEKSWKNYMNDIVLVGYMNLENAGADW